MNDEEKREWQKLLAIADANRSECQRLIEENQDLQHDMAKMRGKYGFPVDLAGYAQWFTKHEQLGHFDFLNGLNRDIKDLMQRHRIPSKWEDAVRSLFIHGDTGVLGPFNMGIPGGHFERLADGTFKPIVEIDDQTALWSSVVQKHISRIQERGAGKPPQPTIVNARGKKDWRPVWEWAKAHPQFTHAEIAHMLGYKDRTHVSKKLEELDQELLLGLEDADP